MKHGIATAESIPIEKNQAFGLAEAGVQLDYPFMLKSRTEAFDGRGYYPVESPDDIPRALTALQKSPLYAEKWAKSAVELAVMVVKTHTMRTLGNDIKLRRHFQW